MEALIFISVKHIQRRYFYKNSTLKLTTHKSHQL